MTTMVKKCEVEGCKGNYKCAGKCTRHYNNWLYTTYPEKRMKYIAQSTALIMRRQNEDRAGRNAYRRAHTAVVRIHGKASQYTCTNYDHCKSFAQDWALDELSDQIIYSKHYHWSENPADYMAMCTLCHREYDRRFKNARNND